ncbi:MAG: hypothetical protein ACTHJ9_11880 [Rhodanobacter sp.]
MTQSFEFEAWFDREYPQDESGRRPRYQSSVVLDLMRSAWDGARQQTASEEALSVLLEIAALKRHDPNRDRGASHGKRVVVSAPVELFARLDAAIAAEREKKT